MTITAGERCIFVGRPSGSCWCPCGKALI